MVLPESCLIGPTSLVQMPPNLSLLMLVCVEIDTKDEAINAIVNGDTESRDEWIVELHIFQLVAWTVAIVIC